MMALFVLHQNFGLAVISAKDANEALKFLKEKERLDECPDYLSGGISAESLEEISSETPGGVVAYFAC